MLYQQRSGGVRTTPVSSPHSSPVSSRRSPSTYSVPRRDKNGDIDSGVYSANSSRDGTPVRGGQHAAGDAEVTIRTRSKVVSHSPKHRSSSSGNGADQNGIHCSKYNRFSEVGEGRYLDTTMLHGKIDPLSLGLISKPIEHASPERRGGVKKHESATNGSGSYDNSNLGVRRRSSDRPVSPSRNKPGIKLKVSERETKSLPRGRNEVRSVSPSPGTDSALGSPEDIKLVRWCIQW